MSDYLYLWESFCDIPEEKWNKIFQKKDEQEQLAPEPKEKQPDEFEKRFDQIDWSK